MSHRETDELRVAYRVRVALNESSERISPEVSDRLAAARRLALSRQKGATVTQTAMAFAGGARTDSAEADREGPSQWLSHLGLLLVLMALFAGLAGIANWQEQSRIDELAEIDADMLADELPPSAYVDNGFNAFLRDDE